jgi:uncharacterized protein (DUF58 family)
MSPAVPAEVPADALPEADAPAPAARKRRRRSRWLRARGRSLEITRAGWLFVGLTLLVGLAAINSGANLLHAIFGAQMALIIGSGVLSESTVRRVTARRRVVGPVHARAPAAAVVEIEHIGRGGDAWSVSVEDDEQAHEGEVVPVYAVRLTAAARVVLPTTLVMPRRGVFELPPAVVATRFPFGLFVKRRQLAAGSAVVVYPAVHPVRVGRHLDDEGRDDEGHGRKRRAGQFHGLRDFRPGDDPRRIHWPAVARLRRPVVREHEGGRAREVVLTVPRGRTGEPGFEREIEDVASHALAWLREGAAVGLVQGGRPLVPAAAESDQARRILDALARVGGAA